MFERGEHDQYPPIGKGGHPPLQAFLGPGCRCANTRAHFTQFLLNLFGGGIDVLGDAFRSRFFWSHDFILSTLLLILQSLLLAPSRQLPMRLPRQGIYRVGGSNGNVPTKSSENAGVRPSESWNRPLFRLWGNVRRPGMVVVPEFPQDRIHSRIDSATKRSGTGRCRHLGRDP